MGTDTGIEWAHHTYNPWIGCTRISPACDHCYAADWAKRYGQEHLWQGERRRTSSATLHKPHKWDRLAAAAGERHRVFCGSLMDFADNQVPSRWRDDAWWIIDMCRNLDWMLLSKRPQNYAKFLPDPHTGIQTWGCGWPHVWLGTTIEDRKRLVNADHLRAVPAAVRFLSIEPLLEDLGVIDLTGIHLVIVGGESGPDARPMHPAWVRSIRDQCAAAGVAFFFKQWGEWAPGESCSGRQVRTEDAATFYDENWTNPGWHFERVSLRASEEMHTDDEPDVWRVGKKRAGRLLDGVLHDAMPGAAHG